MSLYLWWKKISQPIERIIKPINKNTTLVSNFSELEEIFTLTIKKEQAKKDKKGVKIKIAAGLLGIFLGTLGVHNFYLGYTGKATAQLPITVLSCSILSVVSAV